MSEEYLIIFSNQEKAVASRTNNSEIQERLDWNKIEGWNDNVFIEIL